VRVWCVGVVSKAGGWGVGRVGCAAQYPRPLRRQRRGGTPVLVPREASRWLQPSGDTAGGGEDRLCRRGSTDGDSCVSEDRPQVSSSTGGQSGGLVGGMTHGLELGECVLRLPPRDGKPLARKPWPGGLSLAEGGMVMEVLGERRGGWRWVWVWVWGKKPGTDVFYHQGSGTASQATPRGRHRIRAGVGFELAI
jgi:hypothetical protein